jgi:4-hydroxybenzoate polyprenyltransferase
MKAIANAIRFFTYSNIFIAICVTAYVAKTSLLLYRNNGNLHVNTLVFSATLFFYCLHRVNKKKFISTEESNVDRNYWMNTHWRVYFLLLALSAILIIIQLFFMPLRTWIVFVPVGILGIGYTFPIIRLQQGWKRLRDISWLKAIWIAMALSWFTTLLPVVFIEPVSSVFKPEVFFIFIRSFLFIFALCIPFDIRDIYFDKSSGIQTFPVSVGIKTSIYIAISLLLLFISLVCIQFLYFNLDFRYTLVLLISAIYTILLLPLANPKRHSLIFPWLYDGSMLVQWVLVLLFSGK